MPTFCVWLADVDDTVSEKYLAEQFSRYGVVTATYIDRRCSRALVFFDGVEHAQRAVNDVKARPLKDRRLQVLLAGWFIGERSVHSGASIVKRRLNCLQCFDSVGWASGKASSL